MGGKGSGGSRVGAGRKPKNQNTGFAAVVAASRIRSASDRRSSGPELLPAPAGIGAATAAYWNKLAPHAVAARTLIEGTAADFLELCELLVEKDDVLTERRAEGWTVRGVALAKEYRGLVQRSETKLRAFCLAPIGKALVPDKPDEADPFAEFDDDPPVGGAAH